MPQVTIRPNLTFNDPNPPIKRQGGSTNHGVLRDLSDSTYLWVDDFATGQRDFGACFENASIPANAKINWIRPDFRGYLLGTGPDSVSGRQGGFAWGFIDANGVHYGTNVDHAGYASAAWRTGALITRTSSGARWQPDDFDPTGIPGLPRPHVFFQVRGAVLTPRVYEERIVIDYSVPPTVSVSGPSGTVSTSRPFISHVYSQADSEPQAGKRIKVFTLAQATSPHFNPNYADNPVYDSGWQAGTATTTQVAKSLVNGETYRAFVWVSNSTTYDLTNDISAIPLTQFTIDIEEPTTPSLDVEWDESTQSALLHVETFDNLLSEVDSSAESGWGNWTGTGSIARPTDGGKHGVAYMVDGGAASSNSVTSQVNSVAVEAGRTYFVSGWVRTAVGATPNTLQLVVAWFDADNVVVQNDVVGSLTTSTTWQEIADEMIAPANAVSAGLVITTTNSPPQARATHFDALTIAPVGNNTFSIGGVLDSRRIIIERQVAPLADWERIYPMIDDNGIWRSLDDFASVSRSQQFTAVDITAPRDGTLSYRIRTEAVIDDNEVVSAWATDSVVAPASNDWLLKDYFEPSNTMKVLALGPELVKTSSEEQAAFYALGRSNPVILSGAIHGEKLPLTLGLLDPIETTAFDKLRNAQRAVLLSTPHETLWVRFGPTVTKRRSVSARQWWDIELIEVDPPFEQ